VLNKKKERDITVLMGDFNAKIGAANTWYEDVIEKHGLGHRNENGE
jgi:endonuclease/exonuclease/phosphatase family metal-dependent hydrolase